MRGLVLVGVAGAAFCLAGYAVHERPMLTELWPSYGSYAGNKGERSVTEFVQKNLPTFLQEARHTAERYFTIGRVGWAAPWSRAGVDAGGLVLVPTALLGAVGLVVALRFPGRDGLWLVLAAAGFVVPAISTMTARRVLTFDIAWCAFAAAGLMGLVEIVGRGWPRRLRASLVMVAVASIAAWGIGAVFATSAAMTRAPGQPIPFGEAGFGDGITCRGCLDAAEEWEREMRDGAFVVLFDSDATRENATSPGGLQTYGKIAALMAHHPARFMEAYRFMAGWDPEGPMGGPIFNRAQTDFARELVARAGRSGANRIVWHFERPTAWERWLVRTLVTAGGVAEEFATPLSRWPGVRVTTPSDRWPAAFDVLRALAHGLGRGDASSCVRLRTADAVGGSAPVFGIATGDETAAGAPVWLMLSWREHRYGGQQVTTFTRPAGGGVSVEPNGPRIDLIGETGERYVFAPPALTRTIESAEAPVHPGLNCAARVGSFWWTVDPTTGGIVTKDPAAVAVPRGDWIGIAAGFDDTVILADASQSVLVFDVPSRTVRARFPARVFASVRDSTDECSPIAAGEGWIATIDLRTGVLAFYDPSGRDLGPLRADRLVPVPIPFTAFGGSRHHLGLAAGPQVHTFEVQIDPRCSTPDASASP